MKSILFLILLSLAVYSCDSLLLPEQPANNAISNFDLLWKDYDKLYGGFQVKSIDWDDLYSQYRPMVTDESTDSQLYDAITGMLSHLNDNHVFLFPTDNSLDPFTSGIIGRLETFNDFSLTVVEDNYLSESKSHESSILSGRIENEIGYIHFSNFNEGINTYDKVLGQLLNKFKNTRGIIIDVRANEGGYDQASLKVAGHFAGTNKQAFQFRLKNGPGHDDFSEWKKYHVYKEGKSQYTNPVVVLTHRFTISAAETFVLTMNEFEHVTVMGDSTSGAFSDVIRRELPNGWAYGISVGDWRDARGKSFEGLGFPPDNLIQNNPEDVGNGYDQALQAAIYHILN